MFFVGVLGVSLALSLIGMVVLRRHFIVVHTSEVFQFIGLSTKIIRRVLVLDSSPTLDLAKVVLVERLGKFDRLLKPGLHFLMPLLESTKFVTWKSNVEIRDNNNTRVVSLETRTDRISTCETMFDFPEVQLLSQDSLPIFVNGVLFYQVFDPIKVAYEITNMTGSLEQLMLTTLRDIASRTTLDEAIRGKTLFEREVTHSLSEVTKAWGVNLTRVDIQSVDCSDEVRAANTKLVRQRRNAEAMDLQVKSERKAEMSKIETEREIAEARARMKAKEQESCMALEKQMHTNRLTLEREALQSELAMQKERQQAELELRIAQVESNAKEQKIAMQTQQEKEKMEIEMEDFRLRKELERKLDLLEKEVELKTREVRQCMEAGVSERFFISREYTKNFGSLMQGHKGSVLVVPTNAGDMMGAQLMNSAMQRLVNPSEQAATINTTHED